MDDFIELEAKALNLVCPFTKDELNHSFRTLAFRYHPDAGGDPKDFIKIKKAYDTLLPFVFETGEQSSTRTVEGDWLKDLGKGLGDLTNSKDCQKCHGKGWEQISHVRYEYEVECSRCQGSGFVRVAWFWSNKAPCPVCMGMGGLQGQAIKELLLHTCYKCKGSGQTEILHPVLPKGRVVTRAKNRPVRQKRVYCKCGAIIKGDKCWRCQREYAYRRE